MERIKPPDLTQCSKPLPTFDENWLMAKIEQLLSAFRKTDYRNPEAFVTQVAMNLQSYSAEVIEHVTSPTTGLQTRLQWPPSLAEIIEACRAEQAHRDKIARYSSMGPPLPRLPRPKFNVADSYEEMVKKHGRPFGPFEQGRICGYGGQDS